MRDCTLNARWNGRPPVHGEWLKAPKGRTAYEIVSVDRIDPRRNKKRYSLKLRCVRHVPSDIPEGATVHEFRWDPREKSRR